MPLAKNPRAVDIESCAKAYAGVVKRRWEDAKTLHLVTKSLAVAVPTGSLVVSTRRALEEQITGTLSDVAQMRKLSAKLARLAEDLNQ